MHALYVDRAVVWKAKLKEGRKPLRLKRIARVLQLAHHIVQIAPEVMRQCKAVLQCSTPANELMLIRGLPEARDQSAQEKHLDEAHADVRRHLKRPHFNQPQATAGVFR